MSIREKLKNRQADVQTHDLLGETVEIRKMSLKERSEFLDFSNSLRDGDKTDRRINWGAVVEQYAKLFATCVYDPETKAPVFEYGNEDHRAILHSLDPEPVDELAVACLNFNGLGNKESKSEGKDDSTADVPST